MTDQVHATLPRPGSRYGAVIDTNQFGTGTGVRMGAADSLLKSQGYLGSASARGQMHAYELRFRQSCPGAPFAAYSLRIPWSQRAPYRWPRYCAGRELLPRLQHQTIVDWVSSAGRHAGSRHSFLPSSTTSGETCG